MEIKFTKNTLVKLLTVALLLIFSSLSSKAIDRGYDGQTPLFVTISTNWCFACKILEPVVEQLKQEYSGRVTFIKLDVTSDESLFYAQKLAEDYGIIEYFNGNRYAFPRVAVYCPGGLSPTKSYLGAEKIELLRQGLNDLLQNTETACNINGRPAIASSGSERPTEPDQAEEVYGRPDEESELLDRPAEVIGSGRPTELKFWTYGQPMLISDYIYAKTLVLPKCTSPDQVLCYNNSGIKEINSSDSKPPFRPYNPNATRDEKAFALGTVTR